MTFKKKIIFLSGKKGGFTAMLPLLQLFKKSKKFTLKTVLTDQHTQKKFGNTYKICQKEPFHCYRPVFIQFLTRIIKDETFLFTTYKKKGL